jgi:hypothetical protein
MVTAVFTFFAASAAFGLPGQKLLYPGDWAYDALAVLSQDAGLVFFADSTVTVSQLGAMLGEIDEETLSDAGRNLRRQLRSYLDAPALFSYQSDGLSVGADLSFSAEAFVKSNDAVPWVHDYHERTPLFTAPLTLSFGSFLTAGLDPQFAQNEKTALSAENPVNIPLDPVAEADLHFPKRAYLSLGIPFGTASGVYAAIGIGENFFGRTRTGSILLSDYLDRVSFARLSLFSPNLRYGAEIMQLEAVKYLYMHYIQVRLFRRVSLSLTEGVMVNAPLELRYLNPMMVFHNLEPWKTYDDYNDDLGNGSTPAEPTGETRAGAFFGVRLEAQPWRYVRLYGLFGMNQAQLPIEREKWGNVLTPDAMAFQAGIEASVPAGGWLGRMEGYWRFGLEGVYTYPYMYIKYDKGWSFFKESAQVDNMTLRQWTGTPFGPDSVAGTVWAGYELPRAWAFSASFLFAAQGELSSTAIFDTDAYRSTPAVSSVVTPPTGTPAYTATTTLTGAWSPRPWLTLTLQPALRTVTNSGHVSGKTEQSFELAFTARFKPER